MPSARARGRAHRAPASGDAGSFCPAAKFVRAPTGTRLARIYASQRETRCEMKRWSLLACLLLALAACDRRDDADVPASSTGSGTPPGEAVDPGGDDKAATRDAPVQLTQPPPAATDCDGKVGDELGDCIRDRGQRERGGAPPP
jgi:hypothetical protein